MKISDAGELFAKRFSEICNTSLPKITIVEKGGENFIAIEVGSITPFYTDVLAEVRKEFKNNPFINQVFLRKVAPATWLRSIEAETLQRVISDTITIGKSNLSSPYYRQLIPFLGGEERRILAESNHIVYGRRGAGKSSLIMYACRQAGENRFPFVWVAAQQYAGRNDILVVPQILHEIIDAVKKLYPTYRSTLEELREIVISMESEGARLTKDFVKQKLPSFTRVLAPIALTKSRFYVFLDDLHLIHPETQPFVLSCLYSFSRGNAIYLKITSIENMTNLQNEALGEGLQTPGDAQVIRLDYNLVDPGAARRHIEAIINGYVKYAGIPSIASLASRQTIDRLVWVSAGVPRDAIYIFNNSISSAISADRRKVAVTDINMTAADSLTEKERYVKQDAGAYADDVTTVLDDVKNYCLGEIRSNAFLARIDNNSYVYRILRKISDLRFIHVLHPGITPGKAGEKFEAFMLDYAFYTGFRKAPSVKEFIAKPIQPTAKDLRRLKPYPYKQRMKTLEDSA